jgi:hypothetical protein
MRRQAFVWVHLLAVIGLWVLAASHASAGHTIESGSCWEGGSHPYLCRNTWVEGQLLKVRLIDEFSSVRPAWYSSAETARSNWTLAAGPQVLSWSPQTNDTWVYLNWGETGNPAALTSTVAGTTFNCPVGGGTCLNTNTAMNIWYSDLFFNDDLFDGWGSALRTNVFAHEIGHALGLFHHAADVLMKSTVDADHLGPTSTDIGPSDPCNGGRGIRCIYNW